MQEQAGLTNLAVLDIDAVETSTTGESSGGPGVGAIVGGVLAAVVVIAGAIAAFLYVRRRRDLKHAHKHLSHPEHHEGMVRFFHLPDFGSITNTNSLPMTLYQTTILDGQQADTAATTLHEPPSLRCLSTRQL